MIGTVLLVDPDARTRQCLLARLEAAGHRVHEAETVDEAIQSAAECPVEVALLDLANLGAAALQLIPAIRRVRPRTEILLITDRDQIQLAIQGMKLGASGETPAPLDVERLLQEVAAAVNRYGESRRSGSFGSPGDR